MNKAILAISLISLLSASHSFGQSDKLAQEGKIYELTDEVQLRPLIENFQQNLSALIPDTRIQACFDATQYLSQDGGRDGSCGAACYVKTRDETRTLMMCNDVLVGDFTLKMSGFAITRDFVIEFTRMNCAG